MKVLGGPEAKHPDSDSDVNEHGTCKAECLAWRDRRSGKVLLLSAGPCTDAAAHDATHVLDDGERQELRTAICIINAHQHFEFSIGNAEIMQKLPLKV